MNLFLNYLLITVAGILFIFYIVNLVINLIRSNNVKKELLKNPLSVKGKIAKIVSQKKRTYILVRYKSPANNQIFERVFEYAEKDWNNRKEVGDEINIIYPDCSNLKRIFTFPMFLEGDKLKMPAQSMIMDILLAVFGGYVFGMILFSAISKHALTTSVPLVTTSEETGVYDSALILLIYAIMQFMLVSYAISRLTLAPVAENKDYLEMYGKLTMAEVKTFKFVGQKNEKGIKESEMQIEYTDEAYNKVEAKCNSMLYSETQEQYITILYDPKKTKNVCYIKTPTKKQKNQEL